MPSRCGLPIRYRVWISALTPSEMQRCSRPWIVTLVTGRYQCGPKPGRKPPLLLTKNSIGFYECFFGLRNFPATFQRFVYITLSGITWKTCLVYFDVIIVFSKTAAEHMAHLDAVLHRLYRAVMTVTGPNTLGVVFDVLGILV
jgi:hypothetical protein